MQHIVMQHKFLIAASTRKIIKIEENFSFNFVFILEHQWSFRHIKTGFSFFVFKLKNEWLFWYKH